MPPSFQSRQSPERVYPRPLMRGDPPGLGPFRFRARLRADAAGVVFLGQAPDGRPVSVAVLTRGAAFDPSARDRFKAAIRGGDGVVGGDAESSAPWVATTHVEGSPGAERFLKSVIITGTLGDRKPDAHSPDFQPHWIDPFNRSVPAIPPPPVPPPAPPRRMPETRKAIISALVTLGVLVVVVLLLLWLALLVRDAVDTNPQPNPQPQPTPSGSTPTPTPTPTPSPSTTPSPSSPGPSESAPTESPTDEPEETGGPL